MSKTIFTCRIEKFKSGDIYLKSTETHVSNARKGEGTWSAGEIEMRVDARGNLVLTGDNYDEGVIFFDAARLAHLQKALTLARKVKRGKK